MSLKNLLSQNTKTEQDLFCNSLNLMGNISTGGGSLIGINQLLFTSANYIDFSIAAPIIINTATKKDLDISDMIQGTLFPNNLTTSVVNWTTTNILPDSAGVYSIHFKIRYSGLVGATTGGISIFIGASGGVASDAYSIVSKTFNAFGDSLSISLPARYLTLNPATPLSLSISNDTDGTLTVSVQSIVSIARLS